MVGIAGNYNEVNGETPTIDIGAWKPKTPDLDIGYRGHKHTCNVQGQR